VKEPPAGTGGPHKLKDGLDSRAEDRPRQEHQPPTSDVTLRNPQRLRFLRHRLARAFLVDDVPTIARLVRQLDQALNGAPAR
jgi:hypothetical protein